MFTWSSSQGIVLPISLLVVAVVATCVCLLTRTRSETIKKIPLMIISATMLILEIIKQIKSTQEGSYDFWSIPLHFCSLFMYFFALAAFFRRRVEEFGKTLSVTCALVFLVIFYSDPTSVIGNACDNIFATFFTAHTFIYHHLIILFALIIFGSEIYHPQKRDHIYVTIGIVLYGVVAIPTAHALNTNFCYLLYNEIPFLEKVRTACGQFTYTLLMLAIGILALNLITFLLRIISRISHHKPTDNFSKIMKILK